MAISSFKDKVTRVFFENESLPKGVGWSAIKNIVKRKLDMIEYATQLSDLKSPPGNQLESLKGNLAGRYSIRINDQWRIVFKWNESSNSAEDVTVCDYH